MAHFTYTLAPSGTWSNGMVPTGADFTSFEQKLFKALNGDEGGTWSPSSPIIIGGAQGLQIPNSGFLKVASGGTLQLNSGAITSFVFGSVTNVEGNVALSGASGGGIITVDDAGKIVVADGTIDVQGGATLQVRNTAIANFQAGAVVSLPVATTSFTGLSGYPSFTTARVRSITQPLVIFYEGAGFTRDNSASNIIDSANGASFTVQLTKLIHGATLANVLFSRRGVAHGGAVGNAPTMEVIRTDITTGVTTSLFSTGPQALSIPGAGVVAQVANSPDQNFTIDLTKYVYSIQFTCESGTNAAAGTRWYAPICVFSNITSLGAD